MSPPTLSGITASLARLSVNSRPACSACASALNGAQKPFHPSQPFNLTQVRNASHGASSIANGPKNRPGRRLGAKRGNGEYVTPNTIIFRQRGSKWHPGENAGMGRDHTIVARQPGYVRYYRDPARHPERKFIGVVFNEEDQLPYPPNAARRRRLGLVAVRMEDETSTAQRDDGEVERRALHSESRDHAVGGVAPDKRWPWESYTGVIPITDKRGKSVTLKIKSDYSYRQTNAEIGRAAEHADVRIQPYRKDRFLAWRKANARRARSALQRSASKRKPKKAAKKG